MATAKYAYVNGGAIGFFPDGRFLGLIGYPQAEAVLDLLVFKMRLNEDKGSYHLVNGWDEVDKEISRWCDEFQQDIEETYVPDVSEYEIERYWEVMGRLYGVSPR